MNRLYLYSTIFFFLFTNNSRATSGDEIDETDSFPGLRSVESPLPPPLEDPLTLPTVPIAAPLAINAQYIDDHLPAVVNPGEMRDRHALIHRIIKLYGARFSDNPCFYQLIDPIIIVTPDAAGSFHLSLVMSDLRLSCLEVYERLGCFTYEGLLGALAQPNGQQRYTFAMISLSSFPQKVVLLKKVWQDIFTLPDDQFEVLERIVTLANRYPLFKLSVLPVVFNETFLQSNWDRSYWDRFSSGLGGVNESIEKDSEADQRRQASLLLWRAKQRPWRQHDFTF